MNSISLFNFFSLSKSNFLRASLIFLNMLAVLEPAHSQVDFSRIADPQNPAVTDENESTGICWIDINNDGFLDLFVSNGNLSNQNNSLYVNDRSGGFRKVVTGAIVNDGGSSIGGTWGDFNNDGHPDLFVANRNNFGNFLYFGLGDTLFQKVSTGSIVTDLFNSNSSHWVDFNKDGYLDLHVINFLSSDVIYMNSGMPSFSFAKNDTSSFLLDGDAFSIVGCWGDLNNDRQPDLFVANGGTQNDKIYINNGNMTMSPITLNDARATLGCSWGDFDNDGDLDLFAASFLNNRSRLYQNSGPPDYNMVPIDTGIVTNDPANSIGSCWGDFDNDGDLDLFVTNDGQNNFLYLNQGAPGHGFVKVTSGTIVSDGGNSFGCATGDYNNDGNLDIYVANRLDQRNFLYKNNGNSNNWVSIVCEGTVSNRSAIGAKVRVKSQGVWQMREVAAQTGYNSQNLWLHYGLGSSGMLDSIIVEWPSGLTHAHLNQGVNRTIKISETGTISAVNELNISVPKRFALHQNYPNPFNPETRIRFDLPFSGSVNLKVFDLLGKTISVLIDGHLASGSYESTFSSGDIPGGVYFYRLDAAGVSEIKKMILVK